MSEFFKEQENKINLKVEDETSLKDVVNKILEWWGILWPLKFRIFGLSLIIGISLGLYANFLLRPKYTASYQLFFQEEMSGLSSAMRLAASFGLGGLGSGSSSSATVKEFLTSRNNITKALMADLDNGRLIDRYYSRAFKKDEKFAQEFITKFDFNKRYRDSILTEAFIVFNEDFLRTSLKEKTGVLELNVKTQNELFTYDLATPIDIDHLVCFKKK